MKNKFLKIVRYKPLIILLAFAMGTPCFSQQLSSSLLNSGGGTFVKANQSLEFSIGDIAVETYQQGTNKLTQGFIQGGNRGTGIKEDIVKGISIYPNPSNSFITISCKSRPVSIEIIDLQGRKLFTNQSPQQNETINIENLDRNLYLLRLVFKGDIPITKRFIKN